MPKKQRKFVWGSPEHKEFLRDIGRKGGLETKRRKAIEEPEYYSRIGKKAGDKVKSELGSAHFSRIGSMKKGDNV
jgi:general stress protein YciG